MGVSSRLIRFVPAVTPCYAPCQSIFAKVCRAMFELRPEGPGDQWEVEALYDLCFAPGREALSSYRLRDAVPPVADLCLVAVDTGAIAAAIRFWPVNIGPARALLLGPVAVHPTHQG